MFFLKNKKFLKKFFQPKKIYKSLKIQNCFLSVTVQKFLKSNHTTKKCVLYRKFFFGYNTINSKKNGRFKAD